MTVTTRLAGAALAGALLLGGCSMASPASTAGAGAPMDKAGPQATAAGGTAEKAPGAPQADGRQIARTAAVTLSVEDVPEAASRLRRVAEARGGVITAENIQITDSGSSRSSTVTLSVPADQLDATLGDVAGVGKVVVRTVSSQDVTTKVADVEARIRTLRESIARMQALLQRAGSVAEIAQVEAELTKRQAELESLLAQQKALSQMVDRSPVTVTLVTPTHVPQVDEPKPGFLGGLQTGWRMLGSFMTGLLTVVGALIPFLIPAAVVGVPLVWFLRRRRAARAAAAPVPGPDGPQPFVARTVREPRAGGQRPGEGSTAAPRHTVGPGEEPGRTEGASPGQE